jgi:hypothetical protein
LSHRAQACSHLFCSLITDTRAEAAFRTKSLSFASASPDGPSSLSGGVGAKVPILFP